MNIIEEIKHILSEIGFFFTLFWFILPVMIVYSLIVLLCLYYPTLPWFIWVALFGIIITICILYTLTVMGYVDEWNYQRGKKQVGKRK